MEAPVGPGGAEKVQGRGRWEVSGRRASDGAWAAGSWGLTAGGPRAQMETPYLLPEAERQPDTSPRCQPAQETPLPRGGGKGGVRAYTGKAGARTSSPHSFCHGAPIPTSSPGGEAAGSGQSGRGGVREGRSEPPSPTLPTHSHAHIRYTHVQAHTHTRTPTTHMRSGCQPELREGWEWRGVSHNQKRERWREWL